MPVSSGFRNTYQSQFVPLPLEIFARSAEKAQATQDQQVAQLGQTDDALWKVNGVAAEDQARVGEIKAGFEEAANSLVNKDLTRRENQEAVKGLIKGTSRDKDLNAIMTNRAKYDEWQANVQEAKKEGHYTPENDMGQATYMEYIKGGGYKSGKAIDSTVMKYMEERPKMEQFFNDMGENGSDSLAQAGDTYYKNGWSGITAGRVNKQALDSFGGYVNTPEGQQGLRRFALLDPKAQKAFKGGAEEYVFKQFLDAGLERVHGKSTSGRAAALNDDRDRKEKQAKEKKEEGNIFGGALTPETPSVFSNGRQVEFDDKGQMKGSGQGFLKAWEGGLGNWEAVKKWWNDSSLNSGEEADLAHVKIAAKLNSITDKQAFETFDRTSHMVEQPLVGKGLENANKQFRQNGAGLWSHMNLMNIATGERNMNFTDAISKLADEKGVSLPDPNKDAKGYNKALDELGVRVTGTAKPNYFSAKPVVITIGGNTFAADMTYNGKMNNNATAQEQEQANYDKMQKFGSVIEKENGEDVVYYLDLKNPDPKTGEPTVGRKLLKDLKDK